MRGSLFNGGSYCEKHKFAFFRHTNFEIMRVWTKFAIAAVAATVAAVPIAATDKDGALCVSAPTVFDVSEEAEPRVRVAIVADGKRFEYSDEIVVPSDFTVTEEIERRRINDSLQKKIELCDARIQKGADYKSALLYCFPCLERTVNAAAAFVDREPIDAEIVYENGSYTVTSEKIGRALDEDRLYAGLYYSLKFFGGKKTVKATTVTIAPEVTKKELEKRIVLRGRYTTDFGTSSKARAHNVMTAVQKFDGLTIEAGETVSFNDIVGERTAENGFKTAKIIVDGKYVDGIGGGVCQASTAVYNAVLKAGLDAKANAHSICPSYCPPGLDAMISTSSDLIISNNTDGTAYFSVRSGGGRATVTIYGLKQEFSVVPESVVEKVIACGETECVDVDGKYFGADSVSGDRLLVSSGKDGYESATYLKYYKDGKFVKRVKIRSNVYKPIPRIIAVAP